MGGVGPGMPPLVELPFAPVPEPPPELALPEDEPPKRFDRRLPTAAAAAVVAELDDAVLVVEVDEDGVPESEALVADVPEAGVPFVRGGV